MQQLLAPDASRVASVSSASLHVIVARRHDVTEDCDGARKRAVAQAPRQDAGWRRVCAAVHGFMLLLGISLSHQPTAQTFTRAPVPELPRDQPSSANVIHTLERR